MGLYHNCITSQEVKNLEPTKMDEYDYKVCKNWLNKKQKLKNSRIFNLILSASITIFGFIINPYLLILLCFPVAIQAGFSMRIKNYIFCELHKNGGLKKMQELVDYFEANCKSNINMVEKQNNLETSNQNFNKSLTLAKVDIKKDQPHPAKQKYLEKYLYNPESCARLDD